MEGTAVQHRQHIHANLPRLLAELKELSTRMRLSSDSQRDRAKETRQPCLVIRGK